MVMTITLAIVSRRGGEDIKKKTIELDTNIKTKNKKTTLKKHQKKK
jgi:hypothetical protein